MKALTVKELIAPNAQGNNVCNQSCLDDINTPAGGILIACLPDVPAGAGFKFKSATELLFNLPGGTIEGSPALTLDLTGTAPFKLTCYGDGSMPVLMGAGARTIPPECARRADGIRLRIEQTPGTPAPTEPTCLTLHQARIDALVRP
jgi:hypothetical protein